MISIAIRSVNNAESWLRAASRVSSEGTLPLEAITDTGKCIFGAESDSRLTNPKDHTSLSAENASMFTVISCDSPAASVNSAGETVISRPVEIVAPDVVQVPSCVAVTVRVQLQVPTQLSSVTLGRFNVRGSPPSAGFASK